MGEESGMIATVSIVTTPMPVEAVEQLKHQVERALDYAEARQIVVDEDAKGAVEDLSIMAGLKKALEELRQQYTKPINAELSTINSLFKTVSEPLERADKLTRDKVKAYNAEQDRKKAEAERINALKQETARAEMELHGEILPDTNTVPVEVPDGAKQHIRASMGTASMASNWQWEVKNIAEVPDEYKILDSKRITKLVKAGMRSIPGIRIYDEKTLVVTPKKG